MTPFLPQIMSPRQFNLVLRFTHTLTHGFTHSYQLAAVNQGVIDPDCQNLVPGETICLANAGEDCNHVYVVAPGDDCEIIEAKFGINSTVLWQNNPQINSGCTNIYIAEVCCAFFSSIITSYSGIVGPLYWHRRRYSSSPTCGC